MSSLRNAVKRITHKERSQPQNRQRLGILEKKKDYKQRAVDYHRKEDRIKAMKQKAAMKNPDEFYFGMNTSKVQDGKHRSNDDYRSLDPELVRVMKSQDLSYVRMQRQKDIKRADRLQVSLQLLDDGGDNDDTTRTVAAAAAAGSSSTTGRRKHTIFVDTKEEADVFDVAEHFGTVPELAGRAFNRLRKEDVEKMAAAKMIGYKTGEGEEVVVDGDDDEDWENDDENGEASHRQLLSVKQLRKQKKLQKKQAKRLAKARAKAYSELEARKQRAEAMRLAEEHLVTEKLVAGKGRKRKIRAAEDGRPAQYQWRRKRLR